jgi:hypothetical protein
LQQRCPLVANAAAETFEGVVMSSNLKALEQTLRELRRMGRLEKVDAARIQAVKSMAEELDRKQSNSQMWHVYLEALEGLTADGSDDGAVTDLLEELFAPVRDKTSS